METKQLDFIKLYQSILHEIDVGIHAINEEGKTILYNKKMEQIESMEEDDVLHRNLLEVFNFTDEQHSTLVKSLKNGETAKNIKQTYFNNEGKEITTINDTFPIIENNRIAGAVEIARDVTNLEHVIKENILKKQNTKFTFDQIIGESAPLKQVIDEAKRATRTPSSVLLVGETGTGKELFAQSIHNGSARSSASFIAQNCAAIPDNLMESLLFGTKKGAFTGAIDREGLFEQADNGTLQLDEINSLSPALQAKLLRVIQDQTIRRVGDTKEKQVDVRIIATINEDPIEAIANNRLRKDLYYRLSVVSLLIPPLRDRTEDILSLSENFILKYNHLFQMEVQGFSHEVMQLFHQHDWPGNIRELEHTIEGAMNLIEDEKIITASFLPARFRNKFQTQTGQQPATGDSKQETTEPDHARTLKDKMEETEKHYIHQVLQANASNVSQTAKALGISRQSLQYRLKKYGIG